LAAVDEVFGFRKLSQDFDERTNERVVVIEYRVKVKGTMKSAPRRVQQPNQMAMIQQLLAQTKKK